MKPPRNKISIQGLRARMDLKNQESKNTRLIHLRRIDFTDNINRQVFLARNMTEQFLAMKYR